MTPKLILALVLTVAVLAAWVRLVLWRRAAPASPGLAVRGPDGRSSPSGRRLLFLGLFPPDVAGRGRDVLTVAHRQRPAHGDQGSDRRPAGGRHPRRRARARPGTAPALSRRPPYPRPRRRPDRARPRRGRRPRRRFHPLGRNRPGPDLPDAARPRRPGHAVPGGRAGRGPARRRRRSDRSRRARHRYADGRHRRPLHRLRHGPGGGSRDLRLRVKAAGGKVVEQADVPVRIEADAAPRLLILAGAPGPEVKYLRRWATDAGFAVNTQMSAGGGIQLGDPAIGSTARPCASSTSP
jgi:hypothetical protein